MAKLVLSNLSSLANETAAIATINANSAAIIAALEITLSRNGTAPNDMDADLDMDSNDILNLPAPVDPTSPVRLQEHTIILQDFADLEDQFDNLSAQVILFYNDINALLAQVDLAATLAAQAAAEAAAIAAAQSAQDAQDLVDALGNVVLGPVTSTNDNLAAFNGTGGDLIKDSGIPTASVLTTAAAAAAYQPLDSDLTAIAAIAPSDDHIIQRKSGVWINRSIAQLLVDLAVPGTTFQPLDADLTAWAAVNPSSYLNTAGIAAAYQPLDSDLTAIAALTTTSFGRALLTQASAATVQSYLGLRPVLLANATYYVRTDGSDSNNGLANTSGGAFLTLQKAIDTVAALDISIYSVTINVADGTYTAGVSVNGSWIGSGQVLLQGNNTTPGNVLINPAGGTCVLAQNGGRLSVSGMEFRGNVGIWSSTFGNVTTLGPMRFSSVIYQLYANGGKIVVSTNYTICGSALAHVTVDSGGALVATSLTITFESSPAWAGAFLNVSGTGSVVIYYLNTFVHPTVTMTIASPGVITYTGHNMLANAPLAFATTGALPTGIVAGTTYFVKTVLTANTFTVSGTAGGAVINTTGSQSGVHTIISTGSRYSVSQLGQISVNSAGINYLPGNAAGTGTNPGTSPYGLYL